MKTRFLLSFFFILSFSLLAEAQSLHKIDSLTKVLQACKEDTDKVKILNALSQGYSVNDPFKSMEYTKQILSISKRIDFKKGFVYAYQNLGAYYYYKSDYDSASIWFLKAESIAKEINNNPLLCSTYNSLSSLSNTKGDFNLALNYSDKALAIANNLKDSANLKANILL